MEVIQQQRDGAEVVALKGRLDSGASEDFETKLLNIVESGEARLVLDLKELEYISSSGLRVLLKTAKQVKQKQGRMVLCRAKDYIREVLEMSGFVSFLPLYGSLDEALKNT